MAQSGNLDCAVTLDFGREIDRNYVDRSPV
jgi:hypothetical protein